MKLLLPIDGSDSANATLHWAAETFDKSKVEYYLLFVIPVLPDLNTLEYDITDAKAMLHKAKAELEDQGCRVASIDYALGDIADQICRQADELAIDQVILGSHGRTGLAKLLMGSTSTRVLEHCRPPVVIYRESEKRNPVGPGLQTVGHSLSKNTVL